MDAKTGDMWAMVALCGLLLAMQAGADQGDPEGGRTAVTPPPTLQTLPDLPPVLLATPDSFADEATYLNAKKTECQRLTDLSVAESDPLVQGRYMLAAANTMLSFLVEPACSRAFLSLDASAQDKRALHDVLDQVENLLDRANEVLAKVKPGDENKDPVLRSLQRASESLQAFHGALKTYLVEDVAEDELPSTRRHAASKLSPMLEDNDVRVVAAARFWQAVLRRGSSDPQRLLQLLRPVMADLASDSAHAFYSRLLSCRLLASSKEFVSADALLMQLETRCDQWFANEADRADAVRAVALFEMRVVADWYRHLEKDEEARAWCVERIKQITATHFSGDTNTVLRLSPAIPLLVTPDDRERGR